MTQASAYRAVTLGLTMIAKDPFVLRAMPCGWLKATPVPTPFAEPLVPAWPASVVTIPIACAEAWGVVDCVGVCNDVRDRVSVCVGELLDDEEKAERSM